MTTELMRMLVTQIVNYFTLSNNNNVQMGFMGLYLIFMKLMSKKQQQQFIVIIIRN